MHTNVMKHFPLAWFYRPPAFATGAPAVAYAGRGQVRAGPHSLPGSILPAALFAILASLHPVASLADEVVLNTGKDNTLYESATGSVSNGAGEHLFAGTTGTGQVRRGLIVFDIAGNIPAESTINGVTLTLYMSRSQLLGGAHTVSLYAALADWGEGISDASGEEGGGAPVTMDDATWIHAAFPSTPWANAGGDFVGAASAATVVDQIGYYTWQGAGMIADVQSWLDNPATNFGWMLQGNEVPTFSAKRFDTKENINAAFRPALTVQFQPSVPVRSATWGAIKALYDAE